MPVLTTIREQKAYLRDAGRIADDDGWTRVCIRLQNGSNRLLMIGVDANGSDIDVLVSHGILAKIFLVGELAELSEFGTSSKRCRSARSSLASMKPTIVSISRQLEICNYDQVLGVPLFRSGMIAYSQKCVQSINCVVKKLTWKPGRLYSSTSQCRAPLH
jgi:hypothetical protein